MNPDDPNLTSWALNELPESEKHAFELQLQSSTEARIRAQEHRAFCRELERVLEVEECALGEARRDRIREAFKDAARQRTARRDRVLIPARFSKPLIWAAAACVVLGGCWFAVSEYVSRPQPVSTDRLNALPADAPRPFEAVAPESTDAGLVEANVRLAALALRVADTERRLRELNATSDFATDAEAEAGVQPPDPIRNPDPSPEKPPTVPEHDRGVRRTTPKERSPLVFRERRLASVHFTLIP